MNKYIIAPSILSADFAKLGQEVDEVLAAGADWIHFDVMDNHYVSNLTIGPMVCKALRSYGIKATIDAHLMVQPVDELVPAFAKVGADVLSFHPEATNHVDRTVSLIKEHGMQAGVALTPTTSLSVLDYLWEKIDLVLLMSVNPGFGGQHFLPVVMQKIQRARALINQYNPAIRLQVDGGVKIDNIKAIADAGADTFVAGSAIFGTSDYKATIASMRQNLG